MVSAVCFLPVKAAYYCFFAAELSVDLPRWAAENIFESVPVFYDLMVGDLMHFLLITCCWCYEKSTLWKKSSDVLILVWAAACSNAICRSRSCWCKQFYSNSVVDSSGSWSMIFGVMGGCSTDSICRFKIPGPENYLDRALAPKDADWCAKESVETLPVWLIWVTWAPAAPYDCWESCCCYC